MGSALVSLTSLAFNAFSAITQNNGNYAVQGDSISTILVPIESFYVTSYQ